MLYILVNGGLVPAAEAEQLDTPAVPVFTPREPTPYVPPVQEQGDALGKEVLTVELPKALEVPVALPDVPEIK